MSIRVVELSGSPGDMGFQHGRALADEIQQCLAIYESVMGFKFATMQSRAREIEQDVRGLMPALALEIEGIAEGAGREPYELFLLNARSELMSHADGCTALFDPRSAILGQTWDWMQALQSMFLVLRIRHETGHEILSVSEPGMVGKIGLNSAGLGCTLNFLYSPGPHLGTPVHLLLRTILDSTSLEEAMTRVERSAPGQSGNVIIGTASGTGCNIEFAGSKRYLHRLQPATFVHTNHHLTCDMPASPLDENSKQRYQTAQQHVNDGVPLGTDAVVRVLSDTAHPMHPICAPYKPLFGDQPGTHIGTVCTVVMDLAEQRLQVRRGPNPEAAFQTFELEASAVTLS